MQGISQVRYEGTEYVELFCAFFAFIKNEIKRRIL